MAPAATGAKSRKPAGKRTTLADVAALAGVSVVTASYALRNNPKISAPTRRRVARAAKKLSYVPDPELGRLMYLLRLGRPVTQKSSIALLSFEKHHPAEPNQYYIALVEGVKQRCKEIGYNVDPITVAPGEMPPNRLTMVLRARGIQGVLIPPISSPVDFTQLADWSWFSVVAATYTAQNISVNRVVPNHLHAGFLALTKLEAKGFKRIGLVTEQGAHERVNYAFWAALALHQQTGQSAAIPAIQFGEPEVFRQWLRSYRPDVILTVEKPLALALAVILEGESKGTDQIVLLNNPLDPRFAGVYLHPEIVGKTAVDLLSAQIQHGERGYAEHPNVVMVEGRWIEAEKTMLAPRA